MVPKPEKTNAYSLPFYAHIGDIDFRNEVEGIK